MEPGMKRKWSVRTLPLLLLLACWAVPAGCDDGSQIVAIDSVDTRTGAEAVADMSSQPDQPDTIIGPELSNGEVTRQDGYEMFPECAPGSGCFGESCDTGEDCLSGICMDHMGNTVCSQQCVEECPAGWSCEEVGAGGPDLVWICVSDFRVLCRPCVTGADCKTATGAEDVCVSYGADGDFCGGACGPDKACPDEFVCKTVTDDNGIETDQCVAQGGTCQCSEKSIELALFTTCSVENDFGTCEGVRVCTEDGLTDCDAPAAELETCNGLDDDCDQTTDEDTCDDEDECTSDDCGGADGCVHAPLTGTNCDDGDTCTLTDHCEEGTCTGSLIACDDSNPCTDDSCDGLAGCVFEPNVEPCDDGDPCTIGDVCADAQCEGIPVSCDCLTDVECEQYDNDNFCDGTLYCDTSGIEYQCKVDPATIIECPPPQGDNASCLEAVCVPLTGKCEFLPAFSGFACDDGDACTYGELCDEGICQGGSPVNCNDGNECTKDACSPETGCTHVPVGGECNDGDSCTYPDLCADGACVSGPEVDCNDNNACTGDSCNPGTGCVYVPLDSLCDDDNECTTGDHCQGGFCVPSQFVDCNDQDPCTDDSCDTDSGCLHEFNKAPCNDSDLCTIDDHCLVGDCVPGKVLDCNDANQCTDDSCNPLVGCLHTNNAIDCNDSDPCTLGDMCSGGVCVGAQPQDCGDQNPCTDDVCIPMAGCSHNNNSNPCDDGNVCTVNDLCTLGTCVPGDQLDCEDGNVCTDDSCDDEEGCVHAPNVEPCDDNNTCTTGDHCSQGSCVGAGSLECDDANQCTKDICLPGGGCEYENVVGACTDDNPCTVNDHCEQGACVPGILLDCDDGNPCTDDACNQAGFCDHVANQADCDDGNPCTTGDHCEDSACKAAGALDCTDDSVCTTDYCDPATGCLHVLNQAPCDDENVCTYGDHCHLGECIHTAELNCDDFNPCSDDSCDPTTGCQFLPNDLACDDGNACTENDACGNGFCQPGGAVVCDDDNLCTTDLCDIAEGCVFIANSNPCDDNDLCTVGDQCQEATCQPGNALECDDEKECTDDSCDPQSGCVHISNDALCDDNNICTEGDKCVDGGCVPGLLKDCDDDNSCTNDTCDPAAGCDNAVLPDDTPCEDDGDTCSVDVCKDGQCTHDGAGWSGYQGHCYRYFPDKKSWGDARSHCQSLGGDLASTADAAENSFAHSLIQGDNAPWTGLNDQASEGSWKWCDGTPAPWLNWNSGEPNNSGNEDCMHLYHYPGQPYDKKWNDANCGSAYPFLCEK